MDLLEGAGPWGRLRCRKVRVPLGSWMLHVILSGKLQFDRLSIWQFGWGSSGPFWLQFTFGVGGVCRHADAVASACRGRRQVGVKHARWRRDGSRLHWTTLEPTRGARRGVRRALRGESPHKRGPEAARPPKRQWSVASVQELTGQCPGYTNLYSSFGLCLHALAFAHYGPMLHCG